MRHRGGIVAGGVLLAAAGLGGCTGAGSTTGQTGAATTAPTAAASTAPSTAPPPGTAGTTAGLSADDVRTFLETAPAGRRALGITRSADEPVFCGVHVYGASPDGAATYAWALCETFHDTDGRVSVGGGVSMPLRITSPGRSVTVPEDGSGYAASIRAMFPPDVAKLAVEGMPPLDAGEPELLARATKAFSRNGTVG